jgi:hypothetical protein
VEGDIDKYEERKNFGCRNSGWGERQRKKKKERKEERKMSLLEKYSCTQEYTTVQGFLLCAQK